MVSDLVVVWGFLCACFLCLLVFVFGLFSFFCLSVCFLKGERKKGCGLRLEDYFESNRHLTVAFRIFCGL